MTRFLVLGLMMAAAIMAHDEDRGPARNGYGSDYRETQYRRGSPALAAARDLEQIFSRARVDRHEADHFRKAIDALHDFDERSRRGHFDGRALDRALDNMSHLANARQLHPRSREVVRMRMRDLEQMGRGGYRY